MKLLTQMVYFQMRVCAHIYFLGVRVVAINLNIKENKKERMNLRSSMIVPWVEVICEVGWRGLCVNP